MLRRLVDGGHADRFSSPETWVADRICVPMGAEPGFEYILGTFGPMGAGP